MKLNTPAKEWNASTLIDGTVEAKVLVRQLAAYDSIKRADVNFRAETLHRLEADYVPKNSKLTYNERHLCADARQRLASAPPTTSRTEFPVHPSLDAKPRWDPSTGDGGDPYRAAQLRAQQREEAHRAALGQSRRRPARKGRVGLVEREAAFLEEQRAAKARQRAPAHVFGSSAEDNLKWSRHRE